jgi:protoporphyrinogen oxidase
MQKGWHELEHVSIQDFLTKKGGKTLFDRFWKPLLNAKFDGRYETIPMTYIWSRVRRMASTRRKVSQREVMGHIKGNLQGIVDALQRQIQRLDGTIVTDTAVESIVIANGSVDGVRVLGKSHHHDVVISTIPHPQYHKLLPAELRDESRTQVEYMGIVCILLVMKKRLTPYHTLNLVDGKIPYTGIIETTNVIDPALMNGRHLVYIPKYLSSHNRNWLGRTDEDLKAECFGYLGRMFPSFSESDVETVWIGREAFVEPLYTLDFFKNIPAIDGPAKGLFVANNSQTYPFLLNCESVVSLANSVVSRVYSSLSKS